MGGHFFSNARPCSSSSPPRPSKETSSENDISLPVLHTPRLPPAIYHALRTWIISCLSIVFEHVAVFYDHPEKTSFGDVDVLVCGNRRPVLLNTGVPLEQKLTELAAETLSAERAVMTHNVAFVATRIPPEILALELEFCQEDVKYVQIDITFVDAPSQFEWDMAQGAYATFNHALRIGLRPTGFVVLPKGLYVTVPASVIRREMASQKLDVDEERKLPLVFLSNNLGQILEFLGLEKSVYDENEFKSKQHYWTWITGAKFFSRKVFDSQGKGDEFDAASSWEYAARLPLWAEFVDFVKQHPEIGLSKLDAEAPFQEAMEFFPGARMRSYVVLYSWVTESLEARFWQKVDSRLKSGPGKEWRQKKLTQTVTALKRFVAFEEYRGKSKRPVIAEVPELDPNKFAIFSRAGEEGGFTEEELLNWMMGHAEEIRELDRARTRPLREEKRTKRDERIKESKRSHDENLSNPPLTESMSDIPLEKGLKMHWLAKRTAEMLGFMIIVLFAWICILRKDFSH